MDGREDKLRFDFESGGSERLPDEINILKFAAARSKEISAMTECILNPCRTKLVFQSLPVHMRRRVMSHTSARLPRRLRTAHEHQRLKSQAGLSQDSSQLSRRKRRRPRRLLADFARRQRLDRWLETHIWHAKRFHMTKRWGYNLPESPCDKAFRACYRATTTHCLLQDISYYGCIHMSGEMKELAEGFKRITSTKCSINITAKAFITGKREGFAHIFRADRYPFDCIGKVSYLWKADECVNANEKSIWFFAHASFYNSLIEVLNDVFQLKECESYEFGVYNNQTENCDRTLQQCTNKKSSKVSFEHKTEKYYKNLKSIKLMELKDNINRFRLSGPLSHAILTHTLFLTNKPNKLNHSPVDSMGCLETENNYNIRADFWKKIETIDSPNEIQPHLIIGLDVNDPRLFLPCKRTKAKPKVGDKPLFEDLIEIPEGLSRSALWDIRIRKEVRDNKISNFEINKIRENRNLVPGENLTIQTNNSSIPIILLQRPGNRNHCHKRLGYNSGWDIIVPSGYAMPFWVALVLNGARTGGLRESSKLLFESGVHEFDPDTQAGKEEEIRIEQHLLNKYFKLPPNKRVNFAKLSIKSPFICPWQTLVNDWIQNKDVGSQFFVLRDKIALKNLHKSIYTQNIAADIMWQQNCLVPVRLLSLKKGKLADFAIICLLNEQDNPSKNNDPVEPRKSDLNSRERKKVRMAHKITLKRLRRRAIRRKHRILEKAKGYVNVPKQNNTVIINEYLSKMRELWLPSIVDNVRHQCTRETIGFVTKGEFSFTEAKGSGVGFIVLASIPRILKINFFNKCIVLTRNPLSRQYRYAILEIICDV